MSQAGIPAGIEIEPVFLVEAHVTPEAAVRRPAVRRPAVRAEHLTRIAELKRAGSPAEGGAYGDGLTPSDHADPREGGRGGPRHRP